MTVESTPPPRPVHYLPSFSANKTGSNVFFGIILLLLVVIASYKLATYNSLLKNGHTVEVPLASKQQTTGKSSSNYLYFQFSQEPLAQTRRVQVDQAMYDNTSVGSPITATYDPGNFDNFVLGRPSTGELVGYSLAWTGGILAAIALGALSLFAIVKAARTESEILTNWIYCNAQVATVQLVSGKTSSLTITVLVPGKPARRSFDNGTGAYSIHLGDHIPVLYDPTPGKAGVKKIAAIKYVAIG